MPVTVLIDVDADILAFAQKRRGATPLEEKLVEYLYTGAEMDGMPRPTKLKPGS